ncbi:hypothetical protein BDW59DRAFT_73045 [Aspergillus cavernicola]|uniref:GPI transamidase component PIG-S n=1 Tax=Aspergillus cavernicola TaxID=176166 RepID=A0ABR4ICL4_9EURO
MARSHTRHVSVRHSILMLLTILTANASQNHGLHVHKRADTCSGSSHQCSGTGLPDNFCCSSSSTCVTVDSGSSVICCPEGQDCTYIEPITCDVTKQDASLHSDNVIKTTRLDDELPTCGNSCCPFGYTCQGAFCAMDDSSSTSTRSETTSSTSTTTSTSTESPTESTESTEPTESAESSTTTTAETTLDLALPTAGTLSTTSMGPSGTIVTVSTPTLSQYSAASENNIDTAESTCPAYPTNAILAGFFPGCIFGAVAALLLTVCIRRQQRNNRPPAEKVANNTYRKSTGTLMGISDPIASDESSFRTDFLLHTNPKRQSEGARSVLSRSRSRVKSLFGAAPKPNAQPEDIPAVPRLPVTPPRQRQPSLESIRVYTPPGAFTHTKTSPPSHAPYPNYRPNTTLTEILDSAQAAMRAQSSAAGSIRNTNSTAASGTNGGRWLIPPPPQKSAMRKPLPS